MSDELLHIGHLPKYGSRERWYLPEDVITHTMAILAKKGAGKTYVAGVVEEEFAKHHLPFIVLDPVGVHYGIRSTVDGKHESPYPIVVFGGLHADIPLDEHMGEALAEAIIDENISCIIDLSELSKSAWRRFTRDFCRALFKKNSSPRHVFIEEATEFVPQTRRPEMQESYEAVERMVRLGRNRGLGVSLIAQRSAQIAKDVLYALDVLIVLRTIGTLDKKAILDLVQDNVEPDTAALFHSMKTTMASLPTGTAWVWSPEYLKCFTQVEIRARETYHGGATPTFEKTKLVQAKPDVSKLRERLAPVIAEEVVPLTKGKVSHDLCQATQSRLEGELNTLKHENQTLMDHQKRMADELRETRVDAENFRTIRNLLTPLPIYQVTDGERIEQIAPAVNMEEIIRQVQASLPTDGHGMVQVPPPEALRKKYLEQAVDDFYSRIATLGNSERRAMEVLLSADKFWSTRAVTQVGWNSDSGGQQSNVSKYIKALVDAGLAKKGGGGRTETKAAIEDGVRTALTAHSPSDQEVSAVVNNVLTRLVTG